MVINKKIVLLSLLLVVAICVGGFSVYKYSSSRNNDQPDKGTVNNVDYSGPTKEEASAGDQQKVANAKQEQEVANAKPVSTASVRITDATQYDNVIEVRAFISDVYEAGSCSASFNKTGSATVVTSSAAFKDVSNTQCGANDTPRSSFGSSGDWELTLTYRSASGITGIAKKTVVIK